MTYFKLSLLFSILLVLWVGKSSQQLNNAEYYPFTNYTWSLVPATPTAVDTRSTGFGACSCDLTANLCDANCCCDVKCNVTDITKSFTDCTPNGRLGYTRYVCISSSLVTLDIAKPENLKSSRTVGGWGWYCVFFENTPAIGKFYETLAAQTGDQVKKVVAEEKLLSYRKVVSFEEQYDKINATRSYDYYMVGDLIPTWYSHNEDHKIVKTKNLAIPSPVFTQDCEENVFAKYFQPADQKCTKKFTSAEFPALCSSKLLNATALLDGLRISPVPSVSSIVDLYTIVNITVRRVSILENGLMNATEPFLPVSSYDPFAQLCMNATTEIRYIVQSAYGKIAKVYVDLVISDIPASQGAITQRTSIYFLTQATDIDSFDGDATTVSGNPGYRVGSKILVGVQVEQESKLAVQPRLSSFHLPSGRLCSSNTTMVPGFNQDSVTACKMTLSLEELKQYCATGIPLVKEQEIDNMVGMFGNSDMTNILQWIAIATDLPTTSTWDDNNNVCLGLTIGHQFEFLIAMQGSVLNEQWTIVGARRTSLVRSWKFDADKQHENYWLQWRVRFIRVLSQTSSQKVSTIPAILPTLPDNVFYPFSLIFSKASAVSMGAQCLVVVLLTALVLL